MKKTRELIRRIEEGYANQERELERLIKLHSKDILDLNKQQLFKGRDSNDNSLGTYKSSSYALFKQKLNPLGVVDLYLTGAFYSDFFIKRFQFPVQIDSSNEKTPELVKKYGKGLFGLNVESKKILAREILKVEWNKYWRKILHVR